MPTTLKTAVAKYLRAGNPAAEHGTSTTRLSGSGSNGAVESRLRTLGARRSASFWIGSTSVRSRKEGTNPGRTANKAREHLRAVMSWAWEQDLIEALPRFPKPRPQRDVAGRHYLTKAEINALYFATHEMERPRGWDRPMPIGRYWRSALGRVLQLRRRYGDRVEIGAVPRADPLAARVLGSAIARPGGQGTVALGMALLSPGEDGQDILPADESRRSCPHQEHHAGESGSGRSRLPRRRISPQCSIPGTLRPRRNQVRRRTSRLEKTSLGSSRISARPARRTTTSTCLSHRSRSSAIRSEGSPTVTTRIELRWRSRRS